ncbi:MAG: hypothetical protein MJA82_06755 [Clostridia bacterium]|nr:hypothetical protein [Clostridia bacterium]
MNEQIYKELFEEGVFFTGLVSEQEQIEFKDTFDKYEKKMKSGDIFDVKIIGASSNGDLKCILDNDLKGMIENEDVEGKVYDAYTRAKYVDMDMRVAIKKVDRENNIVYLSRALAMEKVRDFLRADLRKKINKAKKGLCEYPIVKAKIMFVAHNNRVYLNIAGVKLLGYIPIKNWKYGFVENPKESIQNNVVVDVAVLRYRPKTKDKNEVFICSRLELLKNPWVGIEERFKRNDVYVVECVSKKEDKFYASMPGLELDIYVMYPDNKKGEEPIIIETGKKYKVRLYRISESERLLRARVISAIRE